MLGLVSARMPLQVDGLDEPGVIDRVDGFGTHRGSAAIVLAGMVSPTTSGFCCASRCTYGVAPVVFHGTGADMSISATLAAGKSNAPKAPAAKAARNNVVMFLSFSH
ncbi:hypothetical protein WPS_13530 [Vulcanimicrobium alpinum]|uniref:Uncharacterized protein n=1 Tax=Vulcanimicrobium alpinum TaxID=3016050 RepID=A0AAN1XVA2_UNVUL|nr:hypothetical protein [Vulcanimicrobium alpinum]BDE06077.1 hypothetical protein WPS_13530 [Vulcanimicrobium alpinum]